MPHKRAKFADRQRDRLAKGHDLPPQSGNAHLRDMPKGAMRILNAAKVQEAYHARKKAEKTGDQDILSHNRRKAKGKAKQSGESSISKEVDSDVQQPLRIKPSEKMSEFSRRVEASMSKEIQSSIRAANDSSTSKKRKRRQERDREREEKERNEEDRVAQDKRANAKSKGQQEPDKHQLRHARQILQGQEPDHDRDWAKAEQRRRVGDVVQAPPKLTKAPRGETDAALVRKAQLKAALSGQDPAMAAQGIKKQTRLPDPVTANKPAGGLKRQAVLDAERERAIKMYRQAKETKLQEKQRGM